MSPCFNMTISWFNKPRPWSSVLLLVKYQKSPCKRTFFRVLAWKTWQNWQGCTTWAIACWSWSPAAGRRRGPWVKPNSCRSTSRPWGMWWDMAQMVMRKLQFWVTGQHVAVSHALVPKEGTRSIWLNHFLLSQRSAPKLQQFTLCQHTVSHQHFPNFSKLYLQTWCFFQFLPTHFSRFLVPNHINLWKVCHGLAVGGPLRAVGGSAGLCRVLGRSAAADHTTAGGLQYHGHVTGTVFCFGFWVGRRLNVGLDDWYLRIEW